MAPQIIDYLRTLGLDSCGSEAELKEAYWREIKKWHPDRHSSDPAMQSKATEHAKKINAAFEILSEMLEKGPLPRYANRADATAKPAPQQSYRAEHKYKGKQFKPGFSDTNVFEVFLKSSCFISTGYDHAQKILYVKFTNGSVYGYRDVPESLFSDFIAAESHGKFAHRHIFHRFREFSLR